MLKDCMAFMEKGSTVLPNLVACVCSSIVPCEGLPLVGGVVERSDGAVALGGHEADDCEEGGADGPGGLPRLGMVAGDGQAYLLVRFEAAVRLRKYACALDDIQRGINVNCYMTST